MATSRVCPCAPPVVTVLFVDDDADTLFAYELVATEAGMRVELARDGDLAIALASEVLPDVIVLDVGLSKGDGFEVARRLRASAPTSAIPLLFLSGSSSERNAAARLASGCEGYLVKPCSPEALLGLVSDLAMRRRDQTSARNVDARGATG